MNHSQLLDSTDELLEIEVSASEHEPQPRVASVSQQYQQAEERRLLIMTAAHIAGAALGHNWTSNTKSIVERSLTVARGLIAAVDSQSDMIPGPALD